MDRIGKKIADRSVNHTLLTKKDWVKEGEEEEEEHGQCEAWTTTTAWTRRTTTSCCTESSPGSTRGNSEMSKVGEWRGKLFREIGDLNDFAGSLRKKKNSAYLPGVRWRQEKNRSGPAGFLCVCGVFFLFIFLAHTPKILFVLVHWSPRRRRKSVVVIY